MQGSAILSVDDNSPLLDTTLDLDIGDLHIVYKRVGLV